MPESGGIDRQIVLPEFRRASLSGIVPGRESNWQLARSIEELRRAIGEHDSYHEQERTALASAHDDLGRRLNELCEFHQLHFYQDNVAANQTDVALLGPPSTRGYVASEDGSICALAVRSNAARTAGSFTVEPRINGTKIGFNVTIDGTNTTVNYDRQDQGIDPFVAGDLIDMVITSTAAWAPTTADIDISCGIVLFAGLR